MDLSDEELKRRMDIGVHRGVAKALAEHKNAGKSIAVWKDDKVVIIPPEDIRIAKEEIQRNAE